MVQLELQLIREVIPLNETEVMIFFAFAMALISSLAAFYTDPNAWGLMGFIVMKYKKHIYK